MKSVAQRRQYSKSDLAGHLRWQLRTPWRQTCKLHASHSRRPLNCPLLHKLPLNGSIWALTTSWWSFKASSSHCRARRFSVCAAGFHACPCARARSDAQRVEVTQAPSMSYKSSMGAVSPDYNHRAKGKKCGMTYNRVLLPTLEPAHRAILLSQSGQQAAGWLTAMPADRRLRLPLGPATGSQEGHSCGRRLDAWGIMLAWPRTGYLAKRAKLVERARAVCREAVEPEGTSSPNSG